MKSNFSNSNKAITILKNRLILLGIFMMPAFLCAQDANTNTSKAGATSSDIKLFSKGKMYVGDASTSGDATMYIEGSAKFGNNSKTEVGTSQIVQIGTTKLTGDFVDAFNTKVDGKSDVLFAESSFQNGKPVGTIWFSGADKVQKIYRAEGVNGEAFGYSYINFPNLRVNQTITDGIDIATKGYVSVDTSAVISVANLEVGGVGANVYKGGFAVEASYVPATPTSKEFRSGYALIKDINNGNPVSSDGLCRVNLRYWDAATPTTNQFSHDLTGHTKPADAKVMLPFSSPFTQLPLDYAIWQVVLKPNGSSLAGDRPIQDADHSMNAGEAYFLAQDVNVEYGGTNQWVNGTLKENRLKGGYEFSRKILEHYSASNGMGKGFSKFAQGAYAEYFNTQDVEITLGRGYNFVGNPYLVPLDMTSLVNRDGKATLQEPTNLTSIAGYTEANKADYLYHSANFAYYSDGSGDVNVVRKLTNPLIAPDTRIENALRSRYDVVNQGYIYEKEVGGWWGTRLRMGVSYKPSMYEGSTSYLETPSELVAPMGMFILFRPESSKVENVKIKIRRPNDLAYLSGKSLSVTPKSVSSTNNRSQELLIQALTGDNMYDDRHCLVFRDIAMDERAGVIVSKSFSGIVDSTYNAAVGTIYTKALNVNDKGERISLSTNFVPQNIKQMALYVVPPTHGNASVVTLKGYRMESLEDIKSVWVEDRLDGSFRELTKEGLDYTLPVSTPVVGNELDYRFILHFSETYDLGITDPTNPVNPVDPNGKGDLVVYYRNADARLAIENLINVDANSKVDVYDIQGRLITRFKITGEDASVGIVERSLNLAQGTYIVRIIGERNHTSKFLSLQN